jgi:nitrate/nitrite transport system substrate-binding protein
LELSVVGNLERPKVTVGFIPLIDCSPILFAEVLGLYERHGLDVELRREVSWSNIRDKVALGLLDAAHMLSPMPLATTLGIDSVNVPMIAAMTLHLNGNSITLSNALWREIEQVAPPPRRQAGSHPGVGLHLLLAQSPAAPLARLGRHRP